MGDAQPSLQRFLSTLQERLADMTADELQARLVEHARSLPSGERSAFLGIFTAKTPARTRRRTPTSRRASAPSLLSDIDRFVQQVSSGQYFLGYGWDDEIHDERSFGDESWTLEMDALFAAAQQVFLDEDLELARTAYQRLLGAFKLDEEVGYFCGPTGAVEMVSTDVSEAEARYLRAVYETTPPPERASVLVEEWFDLPHYRPPTLRDIREALQSDLPALREFLPQWIACLQTIDDRHQPHVRRLLDEARAAHKTPDEAIPPGN